MGLDGNPMLPYISSLLGVPRYPFQVNASPLNPKPHCADWSVERQLAVHNRA